MYESKEIKSDIQKQNNPRAKQKLVRDFIRGKTLGIATDGQLVPIKKVPTLEQYKQEQRFTERDLQEGMKELKDEQLKDTLNATLHHVEITETRLRRALVEELSKPFIETFKMNIHAVKISHSVEIFQENVVSILERAKKDVERAKEEMKYIEKEIKKNKEIIESSAIPKRILESCESQEKYEEKMQEKTVKLHETQRKIQEKIKYLQERQACLESAQGGYLKNPVESTFTILLHEHAEAKSFLDQVNIQCEGNNEDQIKHWKNIAEKSRKKLHYLEKQIKVLSELKQDEHFYQYFHIINEINGSLQPIRGKLNSLDTNSKTNKNTVMQIMDDIYKNIKRMMLLPGELRNKQAGWQKDSHIPSNRQLPVNQVQDPLVQEIDQKLISYQNSFKQLETEPVKFIKYHIGRYEESNAGKDFIFLNQEFERYEKNLDESLIKFKGLLKNAAKERGNVQQCFQIASDLASQSNTVQKSAVQKINSFRYLATIELQRAKVMSEFLSLAKPFVEHHFPEGKGRHKDHERMCNYLSYTTLKLIHNINMAEQSYTNLLVKKDQFFDKCDFDKCDYNVLEEFDKQIVARLSLPDTSNQGSNGQASSQRRILSDKASSPVTPIAHNQEQIERLLNDNQKQRMLEILERVRRSRCNILRGMIAQERDPKRQNNLKSIYNQTYQLASIARAMISQPSYMMQVNITPQAPTFGNYNSIIPSHTGFKPSLEGSTSDKHSLPKTRETAPQIKGNTTEQKDNSEANSTHREEGDTSQEEKGQEETQDSGNEKK